MFSKPLSRLMAIPFALDNDHFFVTHTIHLHKLPIKRSVSTLGQESRQKIRIKIFTSNTC